MRSEKNWLIFMLSLLGERYAEKNHQKGSPHTAAVAVVVLENGPPGANRAHCCTSGSAGHQTGEARAAIPHKREVEERSIDRPHQCVCTTTWLRLPRIGADACYLFFLREARAVLRFDFLALAAFLAAYGVANEPGIGGGAGMFLVASMKASMPSLDSIS